jgi:hypothetical protein
MGLDAPSVRLRVGNDQPDAHRSAKFGTPTEAQSDPPREASLPVERPEKLVHVGDLGLELDDEQHGRFGPIPQQVDHSTLAAERERGLGRKDPAADLAESSRDQLVESRMPGVEQAVEVARSPARDQVDADVKNGADASSRREAQIVEVTPFGPRDRGPRDGGKPTQILLPQASPDPELSEHGPDPLIIHRRSLTPGPWLRLTWPGIDHMFYSSSTQTIHNLQSVVHHGGAGRAQRQTDLCTLKRGLSTHDLNLSNRNI